jgi:uncharacterized membrane protein YqjE
MANDLQSPSEQQNLTTLVTGILNDAQELFRQQLNLARVEMKEDFRKTKEAAAPLAIGVWLALLGSILLSVTLAMLLALTGLPEWACFAIVGAAISLAGGGLIYAGKKKIESFNPLPDKTAEALKENLEWIAKPK